MKRKTLTLCLSLFTCLSLIGVGFAAWIISGGDSKTASGNITVETVTDERFTITVLDEIASIHYGHPATMNTEGAWLINKDGQKENLTVTFDITVTSKSSVEDWNSVTPTATIEVKDSTAWTTAVSKMVVVEPDVSIALASTADDKFSSVYTVTVTAKWGEKFGGNNPYTFYNAKTATETIDGKTYADHALEYLGYVEDIAETAKFEVTITVASSVASAS